MIRGSPSGLSRTGHHASGPALFMVVIVYQGLQDYGSGKHDGKHGEAEFRRQVGACHAPSTRIFSQRTVILHTTGVTRSDLFSDPFGFFTILSVVFPG
jgi:hypothetical protein